MLFGGKKFDFVPRDFRHMQPFDPAALLPSESSADIIPEWVKLADLKREQRRVESGQIVNRVRTPARLPPDRKIVQDWLKNERTVSAAATSVRGTA